MIKYTTLKNENELTITTPFERIEALYANNNSETSAVICAPHPHFDGSMHNKVVTTMTQSCLDLGLNTLRFNYRGVGKSSGKLPTYGAATHDVTFVSNWLSSKGHNLILWLGFSYGSYIAAYASGLTKTVGLITVAPSSSRMPFQDLPQNSYPWAIIQGMKDEVIDIYDNKKLADIRKCNWQEIKEAGHFFHGMLPTLKETTKTIIKEMVSR